MPVWITVLADDEKPFRAKVANFSETGMGLVSARPVTTGTAVQIEGSEVLLLGEAMYSRRQGDGFALGVQIEHVLYRSSELEPLVAAELEEHF